MAWVPQKELSAAVDAMVACADGMVMHNKQRLRIKHPAQAITRDRWEMAICAMLSAQSGSVVMPDGMYLIQTNLVEDMNVTSTY